jgi:MoaA/NifB/PqqE/SkfB family radical SAM enzyme
MSEAVLIYSKPVNGVGSRAQVTFAVKTALLVTTDTQRKNMSKYPNPNFTIMLPGTCNAKCQFCFWKKCEEPTQLNWLAQLHDTIFNLPNKYTTISISGGEPTLSMFLQPVLALLHKIRKTRPFERIGLTTNGARLDMILASPHHNVLDFVNISRHHWGQRENFKAFGVKSFYDLRSLLGDAARLGTADTKVTLNCIIDNHTTVEFIDNYLNWMKEYGFKSVAFRKDGDSLTPTAVEHHFVRIYGRALENGCPVCRTNTQRIGDLEIMWKCGLHEPSISAGEVTELIFQPNGKTYADWGFKFEVDVMGQRREKERSKYGGCGGGCGGSGRC